MYCVYIHAKDVEVDGVIELPVSQDPKILLAAANGKFRKSGLPLIELADRLTTRDMETEAGVQSARIPIAIVS